MGASEFPTGEFLGGAEQKTPQPPYISVMNKNVVAESFFNMAHQAYLR